MRSILMASVAIIFSAGAAFAQVSSSSPAPTGAPTVAAEPTAAGVSPGKEGTSGSAAPANSMAPNAMPSGSMSASTPSPAPTGAPNAANVTAPGASPGKMAPAGSSTAMSPDNGSSSTLASMPVKRQHHYLSVMGGGMAMPADATPVVYLNIAKGDIKHNNKMAADNALSMAETRLLDRSVLQGGIVADSSPGVMSIENSRKAVAVGNMVAAKQDIDMAIEQSGGAVPDASSSSTASSAMNSSSTSVMPASAANRADVSASPSGGAPSTMEHDASQSGFGGSPESTSDSGAVAGSNANAVTHPTTPGTAP